LGKSKERNQEEEEETKGRGKAISLTNGEAGGGRCLSVDVTVTAKIIKILRETGQVEREELATLPSTNHSSTILASVEKWRLKCRISAVFLKVRDWSMGQRSGRLKSFPFLPFSGA